MLLLVNFLLQTQEVVPPSVTERLLQGLFNVNINNFLVLSVLLFTIGVAGVLTRRNVIVIFMSIELILNAVNINLVAFSRYWFLQTEGSSNAYLGEIFTLFVIVIAAAEAVIGLGIVIAFYRNRETISVDEIDLLKL